jgi:hypothetical protein
MSDFTKEQQWKLATNAEYQKVAAIIMNLTTASLIVPFAFIKNFGSAPECKLGVKPLHWSVLVGWILLGLALVSGCLFHVSSAKLVKAVCGGYDKTDIIREKSIEIRRDILIVALVVLFLVGLGFLLYFAYAYVKLW